MRNLFRRYYRSIAGADEDVDISYLNSTRDHAELIDAWERNRQRDMVIKHTTAGPHRDDLILSIRGQKAKRIASQGQAKTLTIAMRLAQYKFLAESAGVKPILLLDDIFDKLDANRVRLIIDLVSGDDFGQIFITDTDAANVGRMIDACHSCDNRVFKVSGGCFIREEEQ